MNRILEAIITLCIIIFKWTKFSEFAFKIIKRNYWCNLNILDLLSWDGKTGFKMIFLLENI